MSSAIQNMDIEDVHSFLKKIDQEIEIQIDKIVQQVFDGLKHGNIKVEGDYDYLSAYNISQQAYNELKSWSEKKFITSPEKELAKDLVDGCSSRFRGPRSIEKDIRLILSSKH